MWHTPHVYWLCWSRRHMFLPSHVLKQKNALNECNRQNNIKFINVCYTAFIMGDRWLKDHSRGASNVSHHVSHQNSNAVEINGTVTYKSDNKHFLTDLLWEPPGQLAKLLQPHLICLALHLPGRSGNKCSAWAELKQSKGNSADVFWHPEVTVSNTVT